MKVQEPFGIFVAIDDMEYPCRIVVLDIINLSSTADNYSIDVFSPVSGFKPEVLFSILNSTKLEPDLEFNVDSSDDEDFQPNLH
jgi:hypothetical protein